VPGTLLAERYRIVAKLGAGGMGEVYRADDLVLGQTVALKFLPVEATDNPRALDRFRNEVRIARQVSHPNVCRVYDLGEINGQLYLSMEYVDGEDLGVLLRRIGRLPDAKALEIARKLCAGLAAAHEKGVLHRDLKPGNIMLDARGQVLITDFGLAALAGHVEGAEVRNGTPAYMAPEQLDGKEVTVRSEIYALGLVLYEVFTGKRPFESATLADLVRTRNESQPPSPSTLVPDLDDAVERVIMRCLARDPAQRPASALAVSAALPGGDPLAAALAAGETPSPEMVAAAADTSGLQPRIAFLGLGFIVVALAIFTAVNSRQNGLEIGGYNTSPDVFRHNAQKMFADLGYTGMVADSTEGLQYWSEALNYAEEHTAGRPDWPSILKKRPRTLVFWYRESPRPMIPAWWRDQSMTPGIPQTDEPARDTPGMRMVDIDDQGRLLYLEAIPFQLQTPADKPMPVDWEQLFRLAGLDISQFQRAEPMWASPGASDQRAAWTGVIPGTDYPLRIEAAGWLGKPVYFQMVEPWTKPAEAQMLSAGQKARIGVFILLTAVVFIIPAFIAWRNIRRGKADRRGALRLAVGMFLAYILLWVFRSHFTAAFGEFALLLMALATSLFNAATVWTLYLALEPYIRRHWPQSIISWARILEGKLHDPAVGKDVLFGIVMGMLWALLFSAQSIIHRALGIQPDFDNTDYLLGARSVLGAWLTQVPVSVTSTLIFFFLLFILRVLLRNQWAAAAVYVALWTLLQSLGSRHPWIDGGVSAAIYSIAAVAIVRFGLVTLAVAVFTADTLGNLPVTTNTQVWYFPAMIFALASIAVFALWSFRSATAGRKLISADLLD